MRGTFTLHSGIAVGLNTVLLSFVAFTWPSGPSPVDSTGWPVPVFLPALLLLGTAVVPVFETGRTLNAPLGGGVVTCRALARHRGTAASDPWTRGSADGISC